MTNIELQTCEAIIGASRKIIRPAIDWEQRRYEIAKDLLAAFLSNSNQEVWTGNAQNQAKDALHYADALIKELKENG